MRGARGPRTAVVVVMTAATVTLAAAIGPAGATSATHPPTGASAPGAHRPPGFRPAIVGGTVAGPGTFPWLAYVDYSAGGDSFACSGTVVAPALVLTAGHCAVDLATGALDQASGYAVVTGALNWTASGAQTSGVSRVLADPGYDPATSQDDAALLVLATPTSAPPLRLATPADVGLLAPGSLTAVAGWGETIPGDVGSASDALQYTTTVVQSGAYCNHGAQDFDPVTELCAIDAPALTGGTCFGDSGGPLIADELQDESGPPTEIGIASRVSGQCSTTRPDVFTRADAISGWADGWIAREAANPPAGAGPPPTPAKPGAARMTAGQAQRDAEETAAHVLHARFDRRSYTSRCTRASAIQFTCEPHWVHRGDDYYGRETVYDVSQEAGAVWRDRYVLSWMSDRCGTRLGAAQSCRASTVRGTY